MILKDIEDLPLHGFTESCLVLFFSLNTHQFVIHWQNHWEHSHLHLLPSHSESSVTAYLSQDPHHRCSGSALTSQKEHSSYRCFFLFFYVTAIFPSHVVRYKLVFSVLPDLRTQSNLTVAVLCCEDPELLPWAQWEPTQTDLVNENGIPSLCFYLWDLFLLTLLKHTHFNSGSSVLQSNKH